MHCKFPLLKMFMLSLAVACLASRSAPAQTAVGSLSELCKRFTGFDFNQDGLAEINRLDHQSADGYLEGTGRYAQASRNKRVLVLVEARLLNTGEGEFDLQPQIAQLAVDLGNEGWTADIVAVDLPHHNRHQDGLHVLALREFLRAVAGLGQASENAQPGTTAPTLAGVILLGRFPDAYLVRTCNWRKKGDLVLRNKTPFQKQYKGVPYLRRVSECVAKRADIVLADLDGRWEDVYVQPRATLQSTIAVFPDGIPQHGGVCVDVEHGGNEYEDFFHISDGRLEVASLKNDGERGNWLVTLFDEQGDMECSDEDLTHSNRIARPDIWVSRIDARGSALSPSVDVVGVHGEGLLDENGQAQVVEFADAKSVPSWSSTIWVEDRVLERQLLSQYLQRNHDFRTVSGPIAFHPSSIAHELGSGFNVIKKASPQWTPASALTPGAKKYADVHGKPNLVEFVQWLKQPAVLRTVRAHSDAWGSVFSRAPIADLNKAVCGEELQNPLSWTHQGNKLVPSLQAAAGRGKLDFFLLRSLWASGQVPVEPSIYLHTGCDITTPPGADNQPFHHPSYARRAGGASLMFFGGGLALVGRAKVFYDEPLGFSQILASGGTIGEAWAQYYEIESNAPTWSKAGGDIGRKRSYFWSVLGDCTLRLNPGDE